MNQTPYQRELSRRIKHKEGLRLMAAGKTKEAEVCFRAVWADAKGEAGR